MILATGLFDPPELIVPLSVGGYIGTSIGGLFSLAVIVGGAFVAPLHRGWGYGIGLVGSYFYMLVAYRQLRAVASSDTFPTLITYAAFIIAVVLAALALARFNEDRGGSVTNPAVPVIAGLPAIVLAGAADRINEVFADVPISWGVVIPIVVAFIAWVKN